MGSKRAKERKRADKPSFDETALAQLTSRIDKSLAESEKQRPPKRKRQRDNDDGHDQKRHQTRPADSNPSGDLGDGRKNKLAATLLDEILALGGIEDDLELVANVDSGDEGGDTPRPKASSQFVVDKSLQDELAQFASSLGFNRFREHEDFETDEDSDPAGEVHDSSSHEDNNEAEEEGIEELPPPKEARQGKQSGKLVSKQRCNGAPPAGISNNSRLTCPRSSILVLIGTGSPWRACRWGLREVASSIRLLSRTSKRTRRSC
jgi:ribosome biogenesis protein MAK21